MLVISYSLWIVNYEFLENMEKGVICEALALLCGIVYGVWMFGLIMEKRMTNKSKYTLLIAVCIAMMLGGCARTNTIKKWQALQGNKDDGIVTLGYYYSRSNIPVTSEEQGLMTAEQTCKTLGYKSAVIYDIPQSECTKSLDYNYNGIQCVTYLVSRNYQCQ